MESKILVRPKRVRSCVHIADWTCGTSLGHNVIIFVFRLFSLPLTLPISRYVLIINFLKPEKIAGLGEGKRNNVWYFEHKTSQNQSLGYINTRCCVGLFTHSRVRVSDWLWLWFYIFTVFKSIKTSKSEKK